MMDRFAGFSRARVLIVGDVMLDRYWWGSVNRISPEAPVPVVKLQKTTSNPGGAANVAVNAAALGASVKLVGLVGKDAEAEELRGSLSAKGIDPSHLVECEQQPTIVKSRVVAQGQQIVRLDREEPERASDTDLERTLEIVHRELPRTDILIISDYGKGLLARELLRSILDETRNGPIPVLVDPKGKHFEKYSGATILTPNRREAAEACKFEEDLPDLVNRSGERLIGDLDLSALLITESENGMTLFQKDSGPVHYDAHAQEVYDVTGAGDTVIACLGVGMAAGLELAEAARLSNIAGGISVQHLGTVSVPLESLMEADAKAADPERRVLEQA